MYIYIYIAGAFDKCADLSPHAGYVVVLVNNGIALEKRRKIKEKRVTTQRYLDFIPEIHAHRRRKN